MAQQSTASLPPVTADAFLADRERFWHSWGRFVMAAVTAVVVLLVLMAIFLV